MTAGTLVAIALRLAMRSTAPDLHSLVFVSITAGLAGAAAAGLLLCIAHLMLPDERSLPSITGQP